MIAPPVTSEILVDAYVPHPEVRCEVRHNQRHVTGLRDHRIIPVKWALARGTGATMRVQVGEDLQSGLPTELPQRSETCPVEDDNAGVEATRVEIVVVGESHHAATRTIAVTKQERATLVPSLSAACNLSEPSAARLSWGSSAGA